MNPITRWIDRPGREPYPIVEGLLCPCCGQSTRRQWEQPALHPGGQAITQTDCLNPSCRGYYMTVTVVEFFRRYAAGTDLC